MKKRIIFSLVMVLIIVSILGGVKATGGGAIVPVTTIELTEQSNDYSMKPGRLKFDFDGKLYTIQVRRINKESVDFLIMTLDMDKQEDITAYVLDDSFNLSAGEKKEVDIDKDGINDISIELKDIISTGKYNSVMSTDFSIKKINAKELETIGVINSSEMTSATQKPISEPVILNQESKEQPTFLDKVINWFRGLFK